MSNCRTCHKPQPCGCQSNNVYGQHPTTPDPYAVPAHYHQMPQMHPHPTQHGYGVIPACLPPSDSCDYGPAQPVDRGVFQALDACGKSVPFARVTVTYVSTNQPVPLFYRPIASPDYAQSNPVITDEKGRAAIFFFSQGHDIRVTVDCPNGDGTYTSIDTFVVYASTLEGNFDLSNLEDKICLEIPNPRILMYDKDNCNRPHAFMDLRYAMISENIAAGITAGSFADVKAYYECLGCAEWEDGVIVWGDCGVCGQRYKYKGTCDQECPPDPCAVDYDEAGESPCWTRCGPTGELAVGQTAIQGAESVLDFETDTPATEVTSTEICFTVTNPSTKKPMLVWSSYRLNASQQGLAGNKLTYPSIHSMELKVDGGAWVPIVTGHSMSWANTNDLDVGSTQEQDTYSFVPGLFAVQPGQSRELCLRTKVTSSGGWDANPATASHTATSRALLTISGGVLI